MQHEAAFQNKNKSVEVKEALSKTGKVKKNTAKSLLQRSDPEYTPIIESP